MKKIVMFLFGFLFLTGVVSAVDLSIGDGDIGVGDIVTLDIMIDSSESVFGGQFDLSFDETVIDFISIEKGDFFSSDGSGSLDSNDLGGVLVRDGKIRSFVVMQSLGEKEGVTGDGILASVKFRGKSEGSSSLEFSEIIWSDDNAQKITSQGRASNGQIIVGSGGVSGKSGLGGGVIWGVLGFIVLVIIVVVVYLKKKKSNFN
jgi:hypothetical protein